MSYRAGGGRGNCGGQLWEQSSQVFEAIGTAVNQDHCNCKVWKMLLEGKIAVYRCEDVELVSGHGQQLAIGDALPPHIVNGKRLVTRYKRRQSGINALVEKNPHAAS